MSDRRLRSAERRWRASGGVEEHGAYLRERARVGELSLKKINLAAFLGDPACRLICSHLHPDGIIIKNKIVYNVEIRDYIEGLINWGIRPVFDAAAAVIRLTFEHKDNGFLRGDSNALTHNIVSNVIYEYAKNPTKENRAKLRSSGGSHWVWNGGYRHQGQVKRYNIATAIQIIRHKMIMTENCAPTVASMAIYLDDNDVRDGIRKEIVPRLIK